MAQQHQKCRDFSRLILFIVLAVYPFSNIYFTYIYDNKNPSSSSVSLFSDLLETQKLFGGVPNRARFGETNVNNDKNNKKNQNSETVDPPHRVAGLSCTMYGGPYTDEAVNDMVYWRDIPEDSQFVSPFKVGNTNNQQAEKEEEQYFTFEQDDGGWNNMRMALETVVGIAVMTGRTLVLPPAMKIDHIHHLMPDKNRMEFSDFFHIESVFDEHSAGLKVISMREFLEREAMSGHLIDPLTNQSSYPPNNQTDWDSSEKNKDGKGKKLWPWLRSVVPTLKWDYDTCVAGFPAVAGKKGSDRMDVYLQHVLNPNNLDPPPKRVWWKYRAKYDGNPTEVDGDIDNRLTEILANRNKICVYDEQLQKTKVIHGHGEQSSGFRLLIHFYAFLFFEDYKHDLWFKRFVRDHFRYIDIVQCAAARIVEKIRALAFIHHDGDKTYDAMHVRRGDFAYQYKDMILPAEYIYENNTKGIIREDRTVYIATDEKNMSYFDPLRKHYNLLFFHDFKDVIGTNISAKYYGMIDQLVASRSDTFVGTFYSTFTGFINRLRGYHSQKEKLPGYENGIINSYYYVPPGLQHFKTIMRKYYSVQPPFWAQEFAVGWRDLDHDIEIN